MQIGFYVHFLFYFIPHPKCYWFKVIYNVMDTETDISSVKQSFRPKTHDTDKTHTHTHPPS